VKKEVKNTRNWKVVVFLFKVISAYLNMFYESFKNCLKTVKATKGIVFSSTITFFIMSSSSSKLFPLKAIYNLAKRKIQLREIGWSWQIRTKSWHNVGHWCFCTSMSLHGMNVVQIFFFHESSWRILWIASLLMFNLIHCCERSSTNLCHHFMSICYCVCILRDWWTPASWIIMLIFKLFEPFRYIAITEVFITTDSLEHSVSFYLLFIQFKTKFGIHSLLHD
jgi:hypothetical protein